MDKETIKFMASQLRQPTGEAAITIGEKMNEGNRLMNLAAIEMLQLKPNDRVLEIGMGNGFFVRNLFEIEPTIQYTGCDFSLEMVTESQKHNAELVASGKAAFFLSRADEVPLPAASVHKVFTVNTIYFWEDTTAVFSEFRRVLRNDGELILAIRPKSIMEKFPVTQHGFAMFSRSELEALLQKNGFKSIHGIEMVEADIDVFGAKMPNGYLVVKATRF